MLRLKRCHRFLAAVARIDVRHPNVALGAGADADCLAAGAAMPPAAYLHAVSGADLVTAVEHGRLARVTGITRQPRSA